MRKKRTVVVVVLLLALVTSLWVLARPRPHRINREGFDRIEEGMTQREVEDILGRPPGDYTDRRETLPDGRWKYVAGWMRGHPSYPREWLSDDGRVMVFFDKGGCVVGNYYFHADDWPERSWVRRVYLPLIRPFSDLW